MKKPTTPELKNRSLKQWPRNPIDWFIAARLADDSDELLAADVQQRVSQWEQNAAVNNVLWAPLTMESSKSAEDASLNKVGVGAFRSDGKRPDRDVYELHLKTHLTRVTALRLDFSTDLLLPSMGPGRADDGNFVLNEIKVFQRGDGAEQWTPASLVNACADVDASASSRSAADSPRARAIGE